MSVAASVGNPAEVLRVERVVVTFGGLRALSDVSIEVHPAEMVGLIGPNGAGKTTLLNVMSGILRPSRGKVTVVGRNSNRLPVHRRAGLGMARTFQRVSLFSDLSVTEHVQVALEASATSARRRGVGSDGSEDAERYLEEVGIADLRDADVATLPLGKARLVELAMALATRPAVLLLDEPFSGLGGGERNDLAELLSRLKTDGGPGIVLVEHDVGMVSRLADRLVVLDFGQVIADGPTDVVLNDPGVRRAYFGTEAKG